MSNEEKPPPPYIGGPAFTPDNRFLVWIGEPTGCEARPWEHRGNALFVYEIARLQLVDEIELESEMTWADRYYQIGMPVFSPDGRTLALADTNHKILILDWKTRQRRLMLDGHTAGVKCISFFPKGEKIASSGGDYRVRTWDLNTGTQLGVIRKSSHLQCSELSSDGVFLATGHEGGQVTVIDATTKKDVWFCKAHKYGAISVAFSPDGKTLATSGEEETIRIFDAFSGREYFTFNSGMTSNLRFSPDGVRLHSIGCSGVLLWDLQNRACNVLISPSREWEGARVFSSDCKLLAQVRSNHEVLVQLVDELLQNAVEPPSPLGRMTKSKDARTGAEKNADAKNRPPASAKGMPLPAHLVNCAVRLQSKCNGKRCTANLTCKCGNSTFQLLFAGRAFEHAGAKHIGAGEFPDGIYLIVSAKCLGCSAEHLIFDKDLHGWNGFVVQNNEKDRQRPAPVIWQCTACGTHEHAATIGLASEGMRDAIEESGGALDESNWQEGFGWISISTKCSTCGHKTPGWLSYETM